ncbi:hypothetical protein [Pediococcus ethanolidurans]|nr:hypothetical protein [Pediococcus ethanolidurans]MBU7554480.1 hypothetical protein [Pediococcus ethanolidurans]
MYFLFLIFCMFLALTLGTLFGIAIGADKTEQQEKRRHNYFVKEIR